MNITFRISNQERFNRAVDRTPGIVLRNMRLAMKISCRDVQHDARTKHRFRSRHGSAGLEGAIETNISADGESGVQGTVGISKEKAYGKYVHNGTGIYAGHSAWQVAPVKKRALRWVGPDGRFCFSRGHMIRGQQPDPFVYEAGENNRQHINDVFARYTDRAIKEAGL